MEGGQRYQDGTHCVSGKSMSGEWLLRKRAAQYQTPDQQKRTYQQEVKRQNDSGPQPEWVRRANEKKLVQKDYTKS
jgi:hypothetical protein